MRRGNSLGDPYFEDTQEPVKALKYAEQDSAGVYLFRDLADYLDDRLVVCHLLDVVWMLEARRGALVVVNDVGGAVDGTGGDAGPGQQVVDAIKAAGGEAVLDTNSVATPEGGAAIVQTALDTFGRIDIVVNNAGILRDKSFHNMGPDLIDPVLDVHLRGAFYVTQPAWVHMREQAYGRVVVTASSAGLN